MRRATYIRHQQSLIETYGGEQQELADYFFPAVDDPLDVAYSASDSDTLVDSISFYPLALLFLYFWVVVIGRSVQNQREGIKCICMRLCNICRNQVVADKLSRRMSLPSGVRPVRRDDFATSVFKMLDVNDSGVSLLDFAC